MNERPRPGRRITPASLVLGTILVLAAAARVWGLDFGLPHTQARPDETQVIDTCLAFLNGRLPRFYDYPWLYMWVLTALYLGYYVWGAASGAFHTFADLAASWPVHWEPFFMISRAMSAAAGTATVYVVYRLARRLWGHSEGLIAAFFMSLAFLPVRESHFGTTDATMTLLIVTSVLLLFRAHESGRTADFAVAGAVAGMAMATKYNAVFVVVPMLASQALHVADTREGRLRAIVDKRLIAFALASAATLAIGIPFVFLDWDRFSIAIGELVHSTRHGMGNARLEPGWIHHLKFSLRYGLGVPLLAAGIASSAAVLAMQWRVGVLLLSFPISYYLVAGGAGNLFARYALPLVPFLCMAAARGLTLSMRAVPAVRVGTRTYAVAAGGIAALILLPSMVSTWHFDRIMAAADNRVEVVNWFKANVPPGQSVLQTGSVYGLAQLDRRTWEEWVWDSFAQTFRVKGQPASGEPDWILVQESPLPSSTQPVVKEMLDRDYLIAWRFTAYVADGSRVYDWQDAFFVPYAGFTGVQRAGPNFTLYKRAAVKAGNVPPS